MNEKKYQGRRELKKHLEGKKLTYAQAAKAKCYDCLGRYEDGRHDCKVPTCPLYGFMPYRDNSQDGQ